VTEQQQQQQQQQQGTVKRVSVDSSSSFAACPVALLGLLPGVVPSLPPDVGALLLAHHPSWEPLYRLAGLPVLALQDLLADFVLPNYSRLPNGIQALVLTCIQTYWTSPPPAPRQQGQQQQQQQPSSLSAMSAPVSQPLYPSGFGQVGGIQSGFGQGGGLQSGYGQVGFQSGFGQAGGFQSGFGQAGGFQSGFSQAGGLQSGFGYGGAQSGFSMSAQGLLGFGQGQAQTWLPATASRAPAAVSGPGYPPYPFTLQEQQQ